MHVEITVWNKWCYLNASLNVKHDISAFLSYKVPNSRFTYSGEEYRSMLTKKGAFKTGFLPSVVSRLKEIGCDVFIKDQRSNKFYVTDVCQDLPTGDLRERQADVMKAIFSNKDSYRGIIDAATNFGKNWLIAAIVKTVESNSKVVITIHRQELFAQLYEFMSECDIDVALYGTYKNKKYTNLGNVTLVMYKTLASNIQNTEIQNHLKTTGTVIVDEAHRAAAREYATVLSYIDAYCVFYLSGTPFTGVDLHDLNMVGDSGEVVAKITNQDLILDGVSQKPIIKFFKITETGMPLFGYQDELLELWYSEHRLSMIKKIVSEDPDRNTLIAVKTKDHGEFLLTELSKLNTTVEFVQSNDPERSAKISAFKDGVTKILITTEILKEGVNLPNIRNLINAAEGKSIVWLKQFLGRALRHDGVNESVNVFDFVDVGKYTKAHSEERLSIYKKEGFDILIE